MFPCQGTGIWIALHQHAFLFPGVPCESNRARSSQAGDYTRMDDTVVNGRFVYRSRDGADYLYFWAPSGDWRVGPDYHSATAGLATESENSAEKCPERAGSWRFRVRDATPGSYDDPSDDGTWVSTPGAVSIACPSPAIHTILASLKVGETWLETLPRLCSRHLQ